MKKNKTKKTKQNKKNKTKQNKTKQNKLMNQIQILDPTSNYHDFTRRSLILFPTEKFSNLYLNLPYLKKFRSFS